MILQLLLYLTFILFSLGQLGRISLFAQQVNFYLYEIFFYFTLVAYFFRYKLYPIRANFKEWLIVFLFFGILMLSFLISFSKFSFQENIISFLYPVRLAGLFLYLIYSLYHVKKNATFKKNIYNGIIFFALITIIISTLQYFFYPNLRNLSYLGWDPHQFRLFGVFFDESVASAIFGLIFLFVLFGKKMFVKSKILRIFLMITYMIFSALSFSRGMYLSLTLTFITYLLIKKEIIKIIFLFLIFGLMIFIIPKPFGEGVNLLRRSTVQSRINDYSAAISLWRKSPIIGLGYNRIRYVKKKENIADPISIYAAHSGASFHSSYLIILVTSGIVGLMFFFGVLFKLAVFGDISKYYVLFLGIFSLFDNIILHPFILFLLFNLMILST